MCILHLTQNWPVTLYLIAFISELLMDWSEHIAALLSINAPEDIECRSLAIIDAEVPKPRLFSGAEWTVARRLIHTTGDFDLLNCLAFTSDATQAGVAALRGGATIFTDTAMAAAGIPTRRLESLGCVVTCMLHLPAVAEAAQAQGITRSLAAVRIAGARLDKAIVVIGNAPTALLGLLELMSGSDNIRPTLIIGMPVGFVNAVESKELLQKYNIPSIIILGRKGGSPLAAATVNALVGLALQDSA
jgi:precorrin-8X/cobalt-precorrin-8 methylmutase